MSKLIMLLRHGKSDWESAARTDFDRPLARRGRRAVPQMADWASDQGWVPQQIFSSPALRARQTAELFASRLALDESILQLVPGLYPGGPGVMAELIESASEASQCVMLVGHNPSMDSMLYRLCGPELPFNRAGKLMTTAAIAVIDTKNDSWTMTNPGDCRLLELMRPKSLS